MSKLKALATVLLFLLLIPLFSEASIQGQTKAAKSPSTGAQPPSEAEAAVWGLIEANQILRQVRNSSTYVATGSVVGVVSKLGENGGIRTYANISIALPIKGNIKPNDILTVWYYGGEVGDQKLGVDILWPHLPGDTVVLPTVFELKVGMSVLFFAYQWSSNVELLLYVPVQTEYMTTNYSMGSNGGEIIILQETQPSTNVTESSGYGFGWNGDHRDWADFPVLYNIDPDGTPDISGTDEFPAIRAAFQTWEDDRFSGVDFTDNGTGVHETINTLGTANGMNVVTWTLRTPDPGWLAQTWRYYRSPHHLSENDIEFNDNYDWSVGAVANRYDVQSVATHEIGHFLRLLDLTTTANLDQTMYYMSNNNSITLRSLEWGDLNGAHYVYPVHNDAGSGGDGSNDFANAKQITKNIWYYGRLCDLPTPDHTLDTQDWYKFYAGASSRLAFTLFNPSNADFDLELYNPSGTLTDYSRNRQNGGSENIARDPMGTTGWWRLRIYRFSTGGQGGNGVYQFKYKDLPLAPQP